MLYPTLVHENIGSAPLNSHRNESESSELTASYNSLFEDYQSKLTEIEEISKLCIGKESVLEYFLSGNEIPRAYAQKILHRDGAIRALDAEFWSSAMKMTDVLECMPAKDRNEWGALIAERKTPPFTREVVIATISKWLESRGMLFAKKVEGVFMNLSGRHMTNLNSGFSERMIVGYVVSLYGSANYTSINHRTAEVLADLRSVIAKIQGRDTNTVRSTYSDLGDALRIHGFGKWITFDNGDLKIKFFKVGTAHLEISQHICEKLNVALSALHPNIVPIQKKKGDRAKAKVSKEYPLHNTFLSMDLISKISNIVESRSDEFYINRNDLSGSDADVFDRVLLMAEVEALGEGSRTIKISKDNKKILEAILRIGSIPEISTHQYYPTKADLAAMTVALAGVTQDHSVLEPSAGSGGLLDLLPKGASITAVEINPCNCAILEAKGFDGVIRADFMEYQAKEKFDRIVMNPPFSDGRALKHLEKAASHLSDDGVLVAILPNSMKNKDVLLGFECEWFPDIESAFDGTKVVVSVLRARKI